MRDDEEEKMIREHCRLDAELSGGEGDKHVVNCEISKV